MSRACPHKMAPADLSERSCGPPLVCSMWVTSETGTVHYGCSPDWGQAEAMLARFVKARLVTNVEIGPCCHQQEMPCCFDEGEDDIDAVVTLSYALSLAEGRTIGRPFRCDCCGHMTYGGCCS